VLGEGCGAARGGVRARVVGGPDPSGHDDPALLQAAAERGGRVCRGVAHREELRVRRRVRRQVALGPHLVRPRGAEEVEGSRRIGGHRAGAIGEPHDSQRGGEGDHRRSPDGAGDDREVHAVLVERERRDRRGVPPVEIVALPRRVGGHAVEIRGVAHDVPRDTPDPAPAQRIGQLVESAHRGRRMGSRDGGVAPPVQHEVAPDDAVHHGRRGVYTGAVAVVGRQQGRRDGCHDQLHVARRHEQAIGVAPEHDAVPGALDGHAPQGTVERLGVQQAAQSLGQTAAAHRSPAAAGHADGRRPLAARRSLRRRARGRGDGGADDDEERDAEARQVVPAQAVDIMPGAYESTTVRARWSIRAVACHPLARSRFPRMSPVVSTARSFGSMSRPLA
jgi:hypothetical protein